MKSPPRIALIHATRVAINPIETAAKKLWPEAEMITILEEGLSADRQKTAELTVGLQDRIVGLTKYAESAGSDGILFTCSAFGQAIEDAAEHCPIPVMKPNEAMFNRAFTHGDQIAMIYTFPPAAPGMEEEFRDAAIAKGAKATLTVYLSEGALDAKRAGDDMTHDRLIGETAAGIADADVILLAQFSMAGAAGEVRKHTNIPVLTSPEAAISELRRRVTAATES